MSVMAGGTPALPAVGFLARQLEILQQEMAAAKADGLVARQPRRRRLPPHSAEQKRVFDAVPTGLSAALTPAAIAQELGLKLSSRVGAVLGNLCTRGDVRRTGERQHFHYYK